MKKKPSIQSINLKVIYFCIQLHQDGFFLHGNKKKEQYDTKKKKNLIINSYKLFFLHKQLKINMF